MATIYPLCADNLHRATCAHSGPGAPVQCRQRTRRAAADDERTRAMDTGIWAGIVAVAWLVLFIWLGIRTLRRGHWIMFIVGIFIPLFWIIGALIPRRR